MADVIPELAAESSLIDLLAPHLLPYAPSAWHELVPAAHWLVKATAPRVFVELGSHAGVSFSAFCEAMRRRRVVGKAIAVDTWRGDEHAGRYDESVYEGFRAFIEAHFKDFAQLMRMTFDEAAGYFSEGSIDLLHIDGFHTYEAVRHDFELWAPKISDRGVVVLHDVNCRNPGFGVWRFWEELAARYPTFEFLHGNGMGIVALGAAPPPAIRTLVELTDSEEIERVRRIFALAGKPHGNVYEERVRSEEQMALLSADRARIDQDRQRIDHELRELKAEHETLRLAFDEVRAERAATLRDAQDARMRAAALERDLAETLARYQSVISSLSWRSMRPLRLMRARAALNAEQIELLKRAAKPGGSAARRVLFDALKRRAGFGPPRPVPLPLPPAPPLSNDEDRALIDALVQRGELPSLAAIVIMGDAPAARLETIIAALDAQIVPVCQIIVHVAKGAPACTALLQLAKTRPDVKVAGVRDIRDLASVEAALVVSGTVIPKPETTAAMAAELQVTGAGLAYSDEKFVDPDAGVAEFFYKPAYSPRLAAATDYMGGCALVRLEGNDSDGLKRIVLDAAAAPDVASYVSTVASSFGPGRVCNVTMPLVEETDPRRASLPPPSGSDPIRRRGTAAIIIPTRDRLNLLRPCVESIIAKTTAPRDSYEIIVVDNGSTDTATRAYLEEGTRLGRFRVVQDDGDFNFARLNNNAARAVSADVLIFLNNDTLIIQGDWLSRLVDAALDERIGVVGAKLLYEDGTVQHGGVVLGIQGVAAHADVNLAPSDPGYHGLAQHDREVSAVTGACMATTREHFWAAGGFDEQLAVAFNDTLLCVNMLKAGLTNLQLNSVLVTHLESKSRGFDDTPARKEKFFAECRYTRRVGQRYFLDDIYYSPNLSLQDTYKPAVVSRRRKPWRAPRFKRSPRVLILSSTHQQGHGVPVVIEQHAAHFVAAGFEVHIGGPQTPKDFNYDGCVRTALNDPFEAAFYAMANDIDVIIPHTPPFFSVARWTGPYPIVAAYDHGEPPSSMFEDAAARRVALTEKTFSLSLAHRRYCNSGSVKDESGFDDMIVVPLGNSHMAHWEPQKETVRLEARAARGWADKIVVLNVCRFHEAERRYKGVDFFVALAGATRVASRVNDPEIVFVQCGKGDPEDVVAISAHGVQCFANVSDEELVELYCAADIYANFSQWEGWNLGIAQALAYGLPVIASDIAAHRQNFDIFTTSNLAQASAEVVRLARESAAASYAPLRIASIESWEARLKPFSEDLLELWRSW